MLRAPLANAANGKIVTMVPDLPDAGLFMNSSQNSKSDMEVLK